MARRLKETTENGMALRRDHSLSRADRDNLSIEDLSEVEVGYDGDVEVRLPDEYEEPDSDTGEPPPEAVLRKDYSYWQSRLAEQLGTLDCNSDTNDSHDLLERPPSRKRRSREHVEGGQNQNCHPRRGTEFEIQDPVDTFDPRPQAKRVRRKSRKTKTSEKITQNLPSFRTELRGTKEETTSAAMLSSETSLTSASSLQAYPDDAMEVD